MHTTRSFCTVALLAALAAAQQPASRPSGWITLFDGTSTAAWRGYGKSEFPARGWKIEDGALVSAAGGGGGDLVTVDEFGDFELEFEWRTTPRANSGVMYRVVELDGASWYSGPEYQVLDAGAFAGGEPEPLHSAGAIYDICPADPAAELVPTGEWNRGRIVVQGFRVQHWLNGTLVAACDFASAEGKERVQKSKFAPLTEPLQFMTHERGRIALQDHGDAVAYRAIRVRPLPPAQALFDQDLSRWEWFGPEGSRRADVWSVGADGAVACKGTPAGYLRTRDGHRSYVLELDWRWPAGTDGNANSGVLLRMVGADKVWPKSLEAQLQNGNAGDFWVIEQFPCTTDPARTSGRNCKKTKANEKPVGEWNRYRITVDGDVVTLEVNGQTLNRATGVLDVAGKICLQSEGAPIEFRNATLTPLP
jgi:hypothetical protein